MVQVATGSGPTIRRRSRSWRGSAAVALLLTTVLAACQPTGSGTVEVDGPPRWATPAATPPAATPPAATPPADDQVPASDPGAVTAPQTTTPTATPAAPAPAQAPAPEVLVIGYRVEVTSPDPALAGAAAEIEAVLEDPRGWQQADIDFQRRDDAPFVVVLAEGDEAQQRCLPYDVGGRFSCQNGPVVVLNAIRWRKAVPHWPGDVTSYRTMLVNHEVGHLIGMHHLRCSGPGAVAPVMEQQSGTLRGCQANAWPTPIELALAATHQFVIAPPPLDVAFPQ